jgi:hypothetical protein
MAGMLHLAVMTNEAHVGIVFNLLLDSGTLPNLEAMHELVRELRHLLVSSTNEWCNSCGAG